MKRIFLIILLAVCAMLASSCTETGTVSDPGKPFSREDWDVCGFKPWVGEYEFEARFGTPPTESGATHNILQWMCGDGVERGAFTNACSSTQFSGGSINTFSDWLLGKEYSRLYTIHNWTVAVTNMSAGVALPRGLYIGSGMEQVKNEFGLGEADEQGIYYGDGENAPYAIIKELDRNYKKEITLAVPAGETNDERYNYTCILKLEFDDKDSLAECGYMSLLKYRILPGLPESEQVSEVRVYSIGKEEPDKALKFEDAIDVLACIQNARIYPAENEVSPTHRIEIVSGGDTYTLKYRDGLIEAPDGRVYEIWGRDEETLFSSLPQLRLHEGTYIRDENGRAVYLSIEQQEEIKRIVGSMVPCSEEASRSGRCEIFFDSGDGYDNYVYLFGTPHLRFEGNTYRISEEDSETIWRIYNEAGSAISEEPLLPGLPSPAQVTEVRIWRIGEEALIRIWKPFNAAGLFEVVQAGSDNPLEGKLESPTHKIQLRSGNITYELTVGSNGIEAPNGKLYGVVFPDYEAGMYLPKSAYDPQAGYITPPAGERDKGWIRGTSGLVKELSVEQISAARSGVSGMTPCADAMPQGDFFTFSLAAVTEGTLMDNELWFTYEYYFGTNYVSYEVQGLVKKALFTISDLDEERLTQIYHQVFGK